MSTLNVTIVQADLYWHDAASNREHFEEVINALPAPGDLIVLPEMFTTGFTMEAQTQAERWNGPSVKWMKRIAAAKNVCLCGSLIIEDNGHFFNRFVMMRPDGSHVSYDKRHLFRFANEHRHYSAGSEITAFEINGFRICPMICYDLRFPVWSRNRDRYDVLLYVANWPSPRSLAWDTLLRARAIENLAYVIGVNRTGKDGNNHSYAGGSTIIDFMGSDMETLGRKKGAASALLDLSALERFRKKFAFQQDSDEFLIST